MEDKLNSLKEIITTREFPFDTQSDIDEFLDQINKLRGFFVSVDNQRMAKECWIIERIFLIKLRYYNAWIGLKRRNYERAWRELVFCEKFLEYLKPHFNYFNDDKKEYFLDEIEKRVNSIQSLYPYRIFASPCFIVKKLECSICNCEISPFNKCEHQLREIYDGEMCFRNMEASDIDHIGLTTNPRWKLRFLKPKQLEFDYSLLSILVDRSKDSMDGWDIQPCSMNFIHDSFSHFNENHYCPCGSRKKYGDCCWEKDEIQVTAYEIRTNSKIYNNYFISMTLRPIEVLENDVDSRKFETFIADPESFYID